MKQEDYDQSETSHVEQMTETMQYNEYKLIIHQKQEALQENGNQQNFYQRCKQLLF